MATKERKSLQDLAEVFEDEPAVNVKRMSGQMDKAKANRLAKKEAKAKERVEGAKMAAKFEQTVVTKVVKTKKAPAPKPVQEQPLIQSVADVLPAKMVATTLEDLAKVVPAHKAVVLPAELADMKSIPEFAALIDAAEYRECATMAKQEYQAKLEEKRELERAQRKFTPRYSEMFSEHMEAWMNEPYHEYRKDLMANHKEPHVKKLRLWIAGVINKALAVQDESANEYLKIEAELNELRSWLSIHAADADQNVFKANQELEKIGARYGDVFVS